MSAHAPALMETRRIVTKDGVEIAYHATPPPRPDARTVVLANGLGGPHLAFRSLVEHLGDRYRLLTWDYRGLYGSKPPASASPRGYAIPAHVRDLEAVLEAERVTRPALVGWSMGVQVVLEACRARPDRPANLVLLNGTAGRPFDTLTPLRAVGTMLPRVLELGRRMHGVTGSFVRRASRSPATLAWLRRLGLVGSAFDDALFLELAQAFGSLDMAAFFYNLQALGEHDASDVLESLRVPALVVTGDRDVFTPPTLAQQMARRIPAAEILVIRGASHYAAVEYPELVGLRIERFFRDHGF